MFSEKYLEIKTKLYEGKIDTDFWGNGMYKEHFYCICLLVVFVDSLFEINKCINNDLKFSSDDNDSNEEISNEETSMKRIM